MYRFFRGRPYTNPVNNDNPQPNANRQAPNFIVGKELRVYGILDRRRKQLHEGIHTKTGAKLAVKFEKKVVNPQNNKIRIKDEARGLKKMRSIRRSPKLIWTGEHGNYRVLAMDQLGNSLETLSTGPDNTFSAHTICKVAIQALELVKEVHELGYIHCSISPKAFFLSPDSGNSDELYISKFRLIRSYLEKKPKKKNEKVQVKSNDHVGYRDGGRVTGVPRYASISSHEGIRLTRRDDIESIGYMLAYFAKGTLPWQGLGAGQTNVDRDGKRELIYQMKMEMPLEEVCIGVPEEVLQLLKHAQSLDYHQRPNYERMTEIFYDAISSSKYGHPDLPFDWEQVESSNLLKTDK